ncbi:hypothetical protein GUJ93_ZPchr0007g5293 [Zizania palustris]|uniref:Uncharacterized protein n=1 Tax=Zizania palustris TaxID=103762 RepID=A0A8J5THR6_ZIZPA|nr:hypothetical protein GUJ93_ZPchr0007g5293 [Zizania palustris]
MGGKVDIPEYLEDISEDDMEEHVGAEDDEKHKGLDDDGDGAMGESNNEETKGNTDWGQKNDDKQKVVVNKEMAEEAISNPTIEEGGVDEDMSIDLVDGDDGDK